MASEVVPLEQALKMVPLVFQRWVRVYIGWVWFFSSPFYRFRLLVNQ
jgi:hypothetical protein